MSTTTIGKYILSVMKFSSQTVANSRVLISGCVWSPPQPLCQRLAPVAEILARSGLLNVSRERLRDGMVLEAAS